VLVCLITQGLLGWLPKFAIPKCGHIKKNWHLFGWDQTFKITKVLVKEIAHVLACPLFGSQLEFIKHLAYKTSRTPLIPNYLLFYFYF
jgi:hypothetical protein